jgi:hypothetical protein
MNKLGILGIAIAAAFVAGSIFTGTTAFADDDRYYNYRDYDDKKHDDRHKDKTLESECAKKLEKKNLNLDGLFCQAIFAIQDMLDMVKDAVSDHETRITDLENQQGGAAIYTVSEFHDVPDGTTLTMTLFCNDGDTVINGYFQAPEGPDLTNRNSYSIITDTAEGFKISVLNFENSPQNVNFVVVCKKAP